MLNGAPHIDLDTLTREQLLGLVVDALARLIAPPPMPPPPIAEGQLLLTAKEVAEVWKVPDTWVRDQARAGKLASVRLGRYVRFRPSDLARFLETDSPAALSLVHRNGIHRV